MALRHWLRNGAVGVILVVSALGPLGASVPSRASGDVSCTKSAAVAGSPSYVAVGTKYVTILGHKVPIFAGTVIAVPATPNCKIGPFSCPSTAGRYQCLLFEPESSFPYGEASSSSGGAGVTVSIETRLSGGDASSWDEIGKFSCRSGNQLSKEAVCSTTLNPFYYIRPGFDVRVLCAWNHGVNLFAVVDKNPQVECHADWDAVS